MLIVHGTLITESRDARIIHDGALRVEGTRIMDLGTSADLYAKYPEEERLDAQGMLVMPGMICAHTHCQAIFARGAPPSPDGTTDVSRRLEASLGYQDIRYATLLSCIEAIRCGTTTFFAHHRSPGVMNYSLDAAAEAVVQAGLRACLSYAVSDRDGMTNSRQGIQENARFARRARETPLLASLMGLEAPATLSDDTLTAAVGAAALSRIGFHVNLAGTRDDARGTEGRSGVRAVEALRRHGVLGPRTLAVHCRRTTLPEVEMLRKAGAWMVHNPRSSARRGERLASISDFLDQGLEVCLGTDGISGNMFSEMQSTYLLHLNPSGGSRSVSADRIARIAVRNNARMASRIFRDRLGELALGAAADIIFVDYAGSPQVTEASLPWHYVMGLGDAHIDTTIVAGRVLMRHGSLCTVDEAAVAARGHELSRRLWARAAWPR